MGGDEKILKGPRTFCKHKKVLVQCETRTWVPWGVVYSRDVLVGGYEGGGGGGEDREEPDEGDPPLEGHPFEEHAEGSHHRHVPVQGDHQQGVHTETTLTINKNTPAMQRDVFC